jgi:hypothetical protein
LIFYRQTFRHDGTHSAGLADKRLWLMALFSSIMGTTFLVYVCVHQPVFLKQKNKNMKEKVLRSTGVLNKVNITP